MTPGLSVFSWYSFVALVIAGVESGLQFPGLTTGLPVRQVLEQGDDTDPQVERDTRLEYVTVSHHTDQLEVLRKIWDVLGNILQEWRQVYLGTPGVLRVISIVDIKGGAIENT